MGLPWSQWFEADYRKKTRHFTCAAQHGIYKNLLGAYLDDGPLKDDDDELRSIALATAEEWSLHWPAIRARFFYVKNGFLRQKRADEVRRSTSEFLRKQSAKGKAGAAKRWGQRSVDPDTSEPPAPAEGDPGALPLNDTKATRAGDDVRKAIEMWNEMAQAAGLPTSMRPPDVLKSKIRARLRDCGGLEGWASALEKVKTSRFCTGGGDKGWRMSLDDLANATKFNKLMGGAYDNKPGSSSNTSGPKQPPDTNQRRETILRAASATRVGSEPPAAVASQQDEFG